MAGRRKKRYDKSVYRSFALIMQFGINMLVPICLMSAFGIWLDKKLDTSYWMVILFFVGAIAGGQNVFRMARQVYATQEQRWDLEEKSDGMDGNKPGAVGSDAENPSAVVKSNRQ